MKICKVCNVEKEETMFYSSKQYINHHCKECNSKKSKEWYSKNKDAKKKSALKHHYKKSYGMSFEDREEMYNKQNGRCLICLSDIYLVSKDKKKRAVIDHCHFTQKVRGMLCQLCNTGLGSFEDNPEMLRRAALYLEEKS